MSIRPIARRTLLGGLGGTLVSGLVPRGARARSSDVDLRPVVRDVRDRLGEGTTWSPSLGALIWVDILQPRVWSLHVATGEIRVWPMPELICWIVERSRGGFVVGLKSGIATLTLDPFEISPIGNPEAGKPANRLNDAKVDRWGRIWAGSMTEGGGADGSLYRLDHDFRWSVHDTGYQVANGPTFSPDGTVMYHSDTPRRIIYAMTLAADGIPRDKRVFARLDDPDAGLPDGMTADTKGGVWVCHWDGGRVSRFRPDGSFDHSILLPVRRATDCCFGGPRLDTLFVSTSSTDREKMPGGGMLYRMHPGHRGMAPWQFAG